MPKRKATNIVWDHQPWKRFIPFVVERSSPPASHTPSHCHPGTHTRTHTHTPAHTHTLTAAHTHTAAGRPPHPACSLETSSHRPPQQQQQPPEASQNVALDDAACLYNSFQFWRIPLPAINLDEIQNPALENAAEEMNCEETEETEAAHVDMDVQN